MRGIARLIGARQPGPAVKRPDRVLGRTPLLNGAACPSGALFAGSEGSPTSSPGRATRATSPFHVLVDRYHRLTNSGPSRRRAPFANVKVQGVRPAKLQYADTHRFPAPVSADPA